MILAIGNPLKYTSYPVISYRWLSVLTEANEPYRTPEGSLIINCMYCSAPAYCQRSILMYYDPNANRQKFFYLYTCKVDSSHKQQLNKTLTLEHFLSFNFAGITKCSDCSGVGDKIVNCSHRKCE